jgi:hypothetical protein
MPTRINLNLPTRLKGKERAIIRVLKGVGSCVELQGGMRRMRRWCEPISAGSLDDDAENLASDFFRAQDIYSNLF